MHRTQLYLTRSEPKSLDVAAFAEEAGMGLATINLRHFPMFPRLRRAY